MAKTAYEYVKAWRLRPENKGKRGEEARRWRAKHPELAKEIRDRHRRLHAAEIRAENTDYARQRRAADPEGQKRRMAAFKARQRAEQDAIAGRQRPQVCELCGGNQGGIVFDHCHTNGDFRGWLCDRCNKVLGLVRDDAALLRAMAGYVGEEANGRANDETKKQASKKHVRHPKQASLSLE